MFRLIVLFAALATINAQYITPALTSQHSNIYRTFGNLGQVSAHSKTIDTPFSSVSKSDVRVSNPGIYSGYHGLASPYAVAPALGHAAYAPALGHAYAPAIAHAAYAPAIASPYARPAVLAHRPLAAAAVPGTLLGVAYSAAPSVAHMTYSNGLGISYAW